MTPEDAGQHALEAALDWIKVSTGLATGALVFGVGLLASAETVPCVRLPLLSAWILYGIAILSGVFAQASLPVMMRELNYNLEHRPFTYPARVHQVTFLLATALLLWSLSALLYKSHPVNGTARTAIQAAELAKVAIPSEFAISRLAKVELLPSAGGDSRSGAVWHFQFEGKMRDAKRTSACVVDVLVDATSGATARMHSTSPTN